METYNTGAPSTGTAPTGGAFSLQATTGPNGFTLQNATPSVMSWTAPNDGKLHHYFITGMVKVTVLETGGLLNLHTGQIGASNVPWFTIDAGGSGVHNGPFSYIGSLDPGSTITVMQDSALTAGAAVLYCEIWGQ